jgi:hypothetical protein
MSAQELSIDADAIDIHLSEENIAFAKRKARWIASKPHILPLIDKFVALGHEPHFGDSYLSINFTGDAKALADVVRALRNSGWDTKSDKPKPGDTSWQAYYTKEDCKVDVFLWFSSSVCRKVKVGTKLVEQDVYEVQCGDTNLLGDGNG